MNVRQIKLEKKLFDALESNDVNAVREILKKGADVNAKGENGMTPLMYASGAELIQLLIDHGADVNAKSDRGYTALMISYEAETTKKLIENGAEIDAKDNKGDTALTYIFEKRYYAEREKILQELINNGVDVNSINNEKNTPLICLVTSDFDKQDQEYLMGPLIKAGADINYSGRDDRKTPLMVVTKLTQAVILVEAGADVTLRDLEGRLAHEQDRLTHFDSRFPDLPKIRNYLQNEYRRVMSGLESASLLNAANQYIAEETPPGKQELKPPIHRRQRL